MQLTALTRSSICLSCVLSFTNVAPAQTITWTGGGATPMWDAFVFVNPNFLYTNWGNVPILPGPGHNVVFGSGFTSGNPNLNGDRLAAVLTVSTASAFTLTGGAGDSLALQTGNIVRTAASSNFQTISVPLVLLAPGTWNIAGSGELVIANSIQGAFGATKTGPGLLTLGHAADTFPNTYTGQTRVSEGTLNLNKADGTSAVVGPLLLDGGAVRISRSNQISDTGGATTINSGTLQLINGVSETLPSLAGSGGTMRMGTTGTMIINQSSNTTFAGTIAGGSVSLSGFTKQGAGSLTLGAGSTDTVANTFVGQTLVSAGVLVLDKEEGTDAIAGPLVVNGGRVVLNRTSQISNSAGTVTVNAGTLDLNGFSDLVPGLSGSGGAINLGAGVLGVDNPTASSTATWSGNLVGTTGLFFTTGNGTLILQASGSLGAIQAAEDSRLIINGGSYSLSQSSLALAALGGDSLLQLEGGAKVTVPQGLVFVNAAMRVSGATTEVQSGGPVEVNGGSLSIDNQGALSTTSSLEVGGSGDGSVMIGTGGQLSASVCTLTTSSGSTANVTVSGIGSSFNCATLLLLTGTGDAVFQVSSGGVANVSSLTHFGSSNRRLSVIGGSFTTGHLSGLGQIFIGDPSGGIALTINGTGNGSYGGSIANTGGGVGTLRKLGSGTQTLSGALSYTGSTIIEGGVLELPGPAMGAGATVTIDPAGTLRAFGTIPRSLAGSGSLILTGNLTIGNPGFVGGVNFTGPVTVGGNTLALMDSDRAQLGGAITMSSGRISSLFGITLNPTGSITGSGTIANNFTNNGAVNGTGAGLTLPGVVDGTGGFLGNVTFTGLYSPGLSPAAVTLGNPTFDNTVRVELGGVNPGTQFDQLNATGTATLGGSLALRLIDGFVALPGQSFNVLNFAARVGDWTIANETGLAGLGFNKIYTSSSLNLLATGLGGDANLDGMVDITDLGILATNWQTSANWLGGDFNGDNLVDITDLGMLATNWQAGVGSPLGPSFADALASLGLPVAAVPEPMLNVSIALFGLAATSRRSPRR